MNILQIVPELTIGGAERTTVELAKFLAEKGEGSFVISSGGILVEDLTNSGARHIRLPVHKKSPFTILSMIPMVAKIIEDEVIDIVHVRSRVPAIIGFFACRRVKKKINKRLDKVQDIEKAKFLFQRPIFITTCHGYYSKNPFSRVMGWGKFAITNSQIISKHMMEDFGVPFERVRLIHRGVDTKLFRFKSPRADLKDGATIGMIGRISPIKGHDDFLKAASRVVRIVPKSRVLIVGDTQKSSKYMDELNLLIRRLGLSRYVEFLPTQTDIVSVLRQMDVLVVATKTNEAFGRVLIEAGACGVPAVATKVGGIIDIIKDKKNGLLVPPSQPIKLADAIIEMLKNRKLAADLATAAREEVEKRFNLQDMLDKTLEVYKDAEKQLKVLIIKLGSVGDVVLAVPSLRAVRKKFKSAHISILIGQKEREILQDCPYVDEMIVYDRKGKDKNIRGFFRILRQIRVKDFDMIIDLQNNTRSHLLGFFSFIPYRIGLKNAKLGFLLSQGIKDLNIPLPPVKHQFRILNNLGIDLDDERLELWPRKDDFRYIDEFLAKNWLREDQPFICINPSASPKWQTKNWPVKKFARLCDELAKQKIWSVIIGDNENAKTARQIMESAKSKPINAVGKTSLIELVCLIKRSKALVSPDSAPIHLAAAMDVPFVVFFGPTDPHRHTPPGKYAVVIKKELKCSPCYKSSCQKLTCMKNITVEEVLNAVKKLMIPHT